VTLELQLVTSCATCWIGGSRAEVQIEEDILAKTEMSARWAQRLIERLDRGERQGRSPGTDEKRCNRDVQAIHDPGLHEARDRDTSALDEHAPVPLSPEHLEDRSRIETVGAGDRNPQDVACGRGPGVALGGAAHYKSSSGTIGEDVLARIEAIVWIKNHANWILARDLPHCKTGVVRSDGTGSDDHGVDQGSKAMEPSDVCWSRHVVGMTTFGRDASIEALTHLRDDQIGVELERQI
jgi:hypothetical protein